MPVACVPIYGAEEIAGCAESRVLPIIEYILEVEITLTPCICIYIAYGMYVHEVIEIYLVCSLILLLTEI